MPRLPAAPAAPARPRTSRRRLSAADSAALSAAGAWSTLAAALPSPLRERLDAALAGMRTAPARDFLAAHGLAPAALDAAATSLGVEALLNFTLAQPQGFLSPLVTTFVPLFDVELTTRVLLQENQNGASVRMGPTYRVAGDGSITSGYLLLPQFTAFITQTVQQLAAAAASQARLAAAALSGDAAAVRSQAAANLGALKGYLGVQLGPLPTSFTVAFEIVLREQLSVNGVDIAAVI